MPYSARMIRVDPTTSMVPPVRRASTETVAGLVTPWMVTFPGKSVFQTAPSFGAPVRDRRSTLRSTVGR